MGTHANGLNCGAVEWVRRNTLRWLGHIERMKSEEYVKKVYISESENVDPSRRGMPLGRWKDRVKEYLSEGGASRWGRMDQARIGIGGGSLAVATYSGDIPRGSEALEL